MSLITHPATIWLRSALRATGLTRSLQSLRSRGGYEEAVDVALLGAIRAGDVVWDVGANVGIYTVKMADKVGHAGKVFAFEPSQINLRQLEARCGGLPNVTVLNIGLSNAAGRLGFHQGSDDLGATSRLAVADEGAGNTSVEVDLRRGDDVVAANEADAPCVVKIDVEGHEDHVLQGLADTLDNKRLRTLVIEVHFGLLTKQGGANVPAVIERRLAAKGFATRWIDSSHLLAQRAG